MCALTIIVKIQSHIVIKELLITSIVNTSQQDQIIRRV